MGMAEDQPLGNEDTIQRCERNFLLKDLCVTCFRELKEPFIQCYECENTCLCASCFAQGREIGGHLSCHSYSVITDRFPLLADNWRAYEERQLLDLIIEYGYGNWEDIGMRLKRPPAECRRHYDTIFLRDPPLEFPELQQCGLPPARFQPAALPPHLLRTTGENPPRMCPGLNGYNALRSEFDEEHDGNLAEQDLALVTSTCEDEDDEDLVQALQASMVEVYNDRLKVRARRHRIIREHGLVLPRKNYATMARFSATLGRAMVESLVPFAQLLTGPQFDFLLEGLHVAKELSLRHSRLAQLRECGLKSMRSANLMQKLARARTESRRELSAGSFTLPTGPIRTDSRTGCRRPAPPLQVTGLPLCERLTDAERELCAQARLVPENFLEFREILTSECRKQNGMRLANARRLIKIDVNKTRKLFDFLMEQGCIFPPPS